MLTSVFRELSAFDGAHSGYSCVHPGSVTVNSQDWGIHQNILNNEKTIALHQVTRLPTSHLACKHFAHKHMSSMDTGPIHRYKPNYPILFSYPSTKLQLGLKSHHWNASTAPTLVRAPGWNVQRVSLLNWTLTSPLSVILCTVPVWPMN